MKIILYSFIMALICFLSPINSDYGKKTNESSNNLVKKKIDESRLKIINNITRCQLYSKKCFIRLILSDIDVVNNLKILSNDKKPLRFISIEQCFLNSTKSDCISSYDFLIKSNPNIALNNLYLFLVYIKPRLVGINNIEFIYNDTYFHSNDDIHATDYFHEYNNNNEIDSIDFKTHYLFHTIIVTTPERLIDKIQLVYVVFFSCIMSILMGVLLDIESLIKIIKMPVAVVIGFISQYVFMPLLSYTFIKLFNLPPIESLALFIYGCSPGGSASNNWTIIFNGDIDLSAIMTFVSTMSSLFMMPLWLFTLGKTLTDKTQLAIPFVRLISNLLFTIIPCLIGIFISKKYPKLKTFIVKITKKLVLTLIISFLIITLIAKYYILRLITWQQWIAAPLIPWFGFCLGGFLAYLAKRPRTQILTISIETGMQNVGIAFMIILLNFSSPESDYAILPLVAVSFLTPIPLWFALLVKSAREKYKKYKKANIDEEEKENATKTSHTDLEYTQIDIKDSFEQTKKFNISQL